MWYFTSNSRVIKINIYYYESLRWLICRFQVNVSLLYPLKRSENQRIRFSHVFKGFRLGKLALNEFLKKMFFFGNFFFFFFF